MGRPEAAKSPELQGPYRGLAPYSEGDAAYFFGRETEWRLISENLRASRLTVLYGESGAGKSSVLQAGVAFHLNEQARQEAEKFGNAEFVVVTFRQWKAEPARELLNATAAALEAVCGKREISFNPASNDVAHELHACAQFYAFEGDLLLILDQFEEYFQYNPHDGGDAGFAAELPKILERAELPVNLLLSVREDSLAVLDRFKGRIPRLLDNRLRIEHLSRRAAQDAMLKPLEQFRTEWGEGAGPVALDSTLADEVLGEIIREQQSAADTHDERIRAPYLQIVMTRWWERDKERGSGSLRRETLSELGGVKRIAENHFVETIQALDRGDQDLAATLFEHMVTAAGRKIALTVSELTGWGRDSASVQSILEKLYAKRLLVTVALPGGAFAYEFAHDVLARAALEWRRAHKQEAELAAAAARREAEVAAANREAELVAAKREAYLEAAAARREAEAAAAQREAAVAAARREAELAAAKQQSRRTRIFAIAVSAVALLALLAAVYGFVQKKRAEDSQRAAAASERVALVNKGEAEKSASVAVENERKARDNERLAKENEAKAAASAAEAKTSAAAAVENARIAKARELAAYAVEQLGQDPEKSVLLGMYAVNASYAFTKTVVPSAEDVLHRALLTSNLRQTLRGHQDFIRSVAFSPDGTWPPPVTTAPPSSGTPPRARSCSPCAVTRAPF